MPITHQDQNWLDCLDQLSNAQKEVIDATFEELYRVAEFEQVKASGDDRAASLEAALVRFLIESEEE